MAVGFFFKPGLGNPIPLALSVGDCLLDSNNEILVESFVLGFVVASVRLMLATLVAYLENESHVVGRHWSHSHTVLLAFCMHNHLDKCFEVEHLFISCFLEFLFVEKANEAPLINWLTKVFKALNKLFYGYTILPVHW